MQLLFYAPDGFNIFSYIVALKAIASRDGLYQLTFFVKERNG